MSGIYGNANDEESIGVIHHAIDKGITFLDSADMYGWGHNETLLGKALKGRRDNVIVASKFGQVKLPDGKQGVDGRPQYVMQACEASLKRLGIEVIDLYYQHRVDPNTPIEDTVGAMKQLIEQGKVRAIGLSEARPETIRRAHKVHPIAAVQNEYSLLYRKEGEETLQACRQLGIAHAHIVSGTHASGAAPTPPPKKPAGATPTIVIGVPLTELCRSTTGAPLPCSA